MTAPGPKVPPATRFVARECANVLRVAARSARDAVAQMKPAPTSLDEVYFAGWRAGALSVAAALERTADDADVMYPPLDGRIDR